MIGVNLDTPILVLPKKLFGGVDRGACGEDPGKPGDRCAERGCKWHTYDWRAKPGSSSNTHRIRPAATLALRDALTRTFRTDAMLVGYAVYTADGALVTNAPRVNKGGLAWMEREGYRLKFNCLFADIDNPPLPGQKAHGPWTPDLRARQRELWETVPALQTAGCYFGGGGWRAVQPLTEPAPIELAEGYLLDWQDELRAAGVDVDVRCKDWTRLYRAPYALRDGTIYCLEPPQLDRMVPVTRPAPTRRTTTPRARAGSPRPTFTMPEGFAEAPPSDWPSARVARVATAVRQVATNWHDLFLALAGALLDRGVAPRDVPALCGAVSIATGADDRTGDRVDSARSTVACAAGGAPYTGDAALRSRWPEVAAALDQAAGSVATARLRRAHAAPTLPVVDLDAARTEIATQFDLLTGDTALPPTMIKAPPGTGKTRGGVGCAQKLKAITSKQDVADGNRWAWSVPDHELGTEVVATARDLGVPVARILSPLAHRTNGAPTCIHHEAATPLVAGGQSVEREFCEGRGKQPCERAATCPARDGYEGDRHANLVVGPHALIGALDAYAGTNGLLVIDEPGEVVRNDVVTLDNLDTALRYLDAFVDVYQGAIGPALAALRAWVATDAPADETVLLEDAIRRSAQGLPVEALASAVDPETAPENLGDAVLDAAKKAIAEDARSKAPPIRWSQMAVARRSPGRAAELGAASRVLDLLWRCLHAPKSARPILRVEGQGEDRRAVLTRLDEAFVHANLRQGPVVTLDANADLRAPAVAKVLGFEPTLVSLRVKDRAPVSRTVIACATATQRAWLPGGVPDWHGGILGAVRTMVAWANEDRTTRSLAVFTWAAIEAALAHAWEPTAEEPLAFWKGRGLPRRSLDHAREILAPILRGFRGALRTGHYFDLRGKNTFADCDACFTLGDPRPNLGAARDTCGFLGLLDEGYLDARAAAELEQAHGRLRTIQRTSPARMGHYGSVLPGGWAGASVEFREAVGGRPRVVAAMAADEFIAARLQLGMGVREFARALGRSPSSVVRWEKGEGDGGGIPEKIAAAVRALVLSVPETPIYLSSKTGVSGTASVNRPTTGPLEGVSGTPRLEGVSGTPLTKARPR